MGMSLTVAYYLEIGKIFYGYQNASKWYYIQVR